MSVSVEFSSSVSVRDSMSVSFGGSGTGNVYSDPKYTILQFLRITYHILIYNTVIFRTWAIL